MKPTKLFLFLAVAVLLGACTNKDAQETQSLTDTYWRNTKTGDWVIGFAEKHVIYDNAVWDIVAMTEQGDSYRMTVSNGEEERNVKVSPTKEGVRRIAVDELIGTECDLITSSTLPDYPTRDDRQGFKDNGYRMGDSVTIVGWLKDIPQRKKAKIIEEIGVFLDNIFLDEYIGHDISLDSLGRFSITVPILNVTEAYLIDHLNVVEPGETYFYLHDYATEKQLIMGNDVRLQNELVAHPFNYVRKQMRMRSATEEEVLQFLKESDDERKVLDEELQQCINEHPNLSQRYIKYVKHLHTMAQGNYLMMAQFNRPKFILPKELVDYVTTNIWNNAHQHPYTLCGDFGTLMYYYTIHTDHCIYSQSTSALPLIERLADEGAITLTDKEADAIERFQAESDAVEERLKATESEEEKQSVIEVFNSSELVTTINALFERAHVDVHATITCDEALHVLDSVKHTPAMRDIYLSRKLYDFIDDMRQPLTPHIMEWIERNIQMEAAKAAVTELNEVYLAVQRRELVGNSLKSSDDVKGMSDGEKILRKLIEPYMGKIILLDIWGTWCGPCKAALKNSQEEYEHLKDYDIVYLYLANRSDEESWKNVIKEYNVTGDNVVHYNLPAEQQTAIEHFLGVNSFPTYKLIDRDGNILDVNADPRDLNALENLLKTMNGTKN
jgi:thiol-disulfide isomerase/thioredoxin